MPAVDHCAIDPSELFCYRAHPQNKSDTTYTLTPIEAHDNGYICTPPGDFLVERSYLIQLETNAEKCIQTPVVQPRVNDCGIDGVNAIVFCADGITSKAYDWKEAQGFLCFSPADFEIERNYRNTLIQDIANCAP
jgi:hypothetical protein